MTISLDLRRRAIAAYERGEGFVEAIAARFSIGRASLARSRWLRKKRLTGSPDATPDPAALPPRHPRGGDVAPAVAAEDPSTAQHVLAARLAEARAAAGEPADCRAHAAADGDHAQKKALRAVQRLRPDVVAEWEAFAAWQRR